MTETEAVDGDASRMAGALESAEERAAALAGPIGRLGGAFMLSEQMKATAKQLGTGGWGMYMIGRGGVLGDVDPAVVTATLWFFPASRVDEAWRRARAAVDPATGAAAFARACDDWAAEHLSDVADLDRLAALLETVARATPVHGAPLFAAWRAVPLPDDPAARALRLCFLMREHRGAVHGVATAALGLSPLQAVLLHGGPGNAAFYGWPEPYPDVSGLADRKQEAERLTDRLAAASWAALAPAEFAECRALLDTAAAAAFPAS